MTHAVVMPYVMQSNSGTFEGTSGTVSLTDPTEAGSTVVVVIGWIGDGTTFREVDLPAGFVALSGDGNPSNNRMAIAQPWALDNVGAGETSWTATVVSGGSTRITWVAMEVAGLDLDFPTYSYKVMLTISETPVASITYNAGGSTSSESYGALGLVCTMAVDSAGTTPTVTHDNGYDEVVATAAGVDASSRAGRLTVGTKSLSTVHTPTSTATFSPSSRAWGYLLVLTGRDCQHAPLVASMTGFEYGTATALATGQPSPGGGSRKPFDAVVGTPAVVATNPRSGNYCLELSSTAAAENVTWIETGAVADNLTGVGLFSVASVGLHVYFPTALPAADTPLASVEAGSLANGVVLRYVAASNKIGLKVGGGTEVLSDATVSANTWIGVSLLYDPRTTTHTCQWQVDYNSATSDATAAVTQTTASGTGMSAAPVSTLRLGWTTALTATARFDDVIISNTRKAYPLHDVRITPLKVDPAGTPTVSGTTTNFQTWTNNGTMAAWTAAGTRNALDDVPPVIGASSDGLAQVANAANDYVEVPMQTFALAPDWVPVAGRWYWCGWAASGNPAAFRWNAYDGVAALNTIPLGDPVDAGFDSTSMVWAGWMHTPNTALFYQLTQAKLDNLVARFGYSNDTNPDAGVHFVLFELAYRPATSVGILSVEGNDFRVYAKMDTNSGAIVSLLATTPAGTRGATLTWTVDGTPGSQYVAANSTHEQSLGAVDVSQVTQVGLLPDPTP